MSHLGDRVAALVDGQLDHPARERALAHVAHCPECRRDVEAQRAVKERLSTAPTPQPPPATLAMLRSLAAPGGPVPPRARTMPRGPLVPTLPPPGRPAATWPGRPRPGARGPANRRPGGRPLARRARLATAGALCTAGLVLGAAFAVGGSSPSTVVPPVAELSVEHSRTSTAVTVGDPGIGLMTGPQDDPANGAVTPVVRR